MTEKELELRIQTAIDAVTPDSFAKERIWAKVSAEKVPEKRVRKRVAIYVVPLCLATVIFGAGIGFLRNDDFYTNKHTEETGKPEYCTEVTVAMTVPATLTATYAQTTVPEGGMIATSTVPMSGRLEAYLPRAEDDFVEVNGKQYLLSWGTESMGEIVGVVESATQAEMLGLAVYATEIDGVVAIRTDAQWLNYRYVGKADGTATMADWLTEYGITADSLAEIELTAPDLERVEVVDGIVTLKRCVVHVTDRAEMMAILTALADGEQRDQSAWDAAVERADHAFRGQIVLCFTLRENNQRLDLVLFPALSFLGNGYQVEYTLHEQLMTLIEKGWN